jgi:taurine dioxygenase
MSYEPIEFRALCPTIGAEVTGLNLAEAGSFKAALHEALLKYKVLFFRNQIISIEQQIVFARMFGELEVHPFFKRSHIPELLEIVHDRDSPPNQNNWHTDVSWRVAPSFGSVLRAVEVPKIGGDTLFADMCAAYDDLNSDSQQWLSGLTAVHDCAVLAKGLDPAKWKEVREKYPPVEHPVIRTHPETGRKLIFVNRAFTTHIVGMSEEESNRTLDFLFQRASIPEYQCRFRWDDNSVALWDNRATQHYAVGDYYPQRRVMHGLRIAGDRPF